MGLEIWRTYFDSCLIIYLVEEHPVFASVIENQLAAHPNTIICVSALSEAECLVMPLRQQNQWLIEKFAGWFERVEILPLEREIFRQTAKLRAAHKALKTPDAIHLATAVYYNCNELWTNDNRLDTAAPTLVKNILTKNE